MRAPPDERSVAPEEGHAPNRQHAADTHKNSTGASVAPDGTAAGLELGAARWATTTRRPRLLTKLAAAWLEHLTRRAPR